jgi:hypothetical protein
MTLWLVGVEEALEGCSFAPQESKQDINKVEAMIMSQGFRVLFGFRMFLILCNGFIQIRRFWILRR